MKKFIDDNLAVFALFGFFLLIGAFRVYRDSGYKDTLPITFSDEFIKEEKELIRQSVKIHLKTWQADFHRNSRWIKIKIVRDFPKEPHLSGRYSPGTDTIEVEAGHYYETPALYHELCHLNLTRGDEHTASGWIYWNQRCYALAASIARRRYQIDLDLIPRIIPHKVNPCYH